MKKFSNLVENESGSDQVIEKVDKSKKTKNTDEPPDMHGPIIMEWNPAKGQ